MGKYVKDEGEITDTMGSLYNRQLVVRKSDIVFMGSMVLYVFFRLLSSSYYAYFVPGILFRFVNIFVMIVLIFKNLSKAFLLKKKYYIFVPVLILCGIVGVVSENGLSLTIFVLLIISAYDIDFEKIIKGMIFSYALIIVVVCVPSILGIIPNQTGNHDGMTAHYVGFLYYTTLPNIVMMLSIFVLYRKRTNRIARVLVLFLVNWLVYKYCTSLHSIVAFAFFSILYLINVTTRIFEKKNRMVDFFSVLFYPLCMGLSLYASIYYYKNPASREFLNKFFNNRIMLMSNSYYENGIHLFGNAINMTTKLSEYNYVDSGYMYLLLVYGIIFSILMIGAYIWLLCKIRAKGDGFIFVWMLTIGIYALSNRVFLSLQYNPILYLLPQIIVENYYRLRHTSKE